MHLLIYYFQNYFTMLALKGIRDAARFLRLLEPSIVCDSAGALSRAKPVWNAPSEIVYLNLSSLELSFALCLRILVNIAFIAIPPRAFFTELSQYF